MKMWYKKEQHDIKFIENSGTEIHYTKIEEGEYDYTLYWNDEVTAVLKKGYNIIMEDS